MVLALGMMARGFVRGHRRRVRRRRDRGESGTARPCRRARDPGDRRRARRVHRGQPRSRADDPSLAQTVTLHVSRDFDEAAIENQPEHDLPARDLGRAREGLPYDGPRIGEARMNKRGVGGRTRGHSCGTSRRASAGRARARIRPGRGVVHGLDALLRLAVRRRAPADRTISRTTRCPASWSWARCAAP